MLISIINLFFSPFCILLFLLLNFGEESKFLVSAGTNVYQLKLIPYIIFSLLYVSLVLAISFIFIEFTKSTVDLWEIYVPKYYWLSGFTWLVTIFTIWSYVKGMEGNIMGFIFFPLIMISIVSLVLVNVNSVLSGSWYSEMPVFELNFGVKLLLHAFSPIYLLMILNQTDQDRKKTESWIAVIVTTLIMQMALFGIHWVILYFFDLPLSFYDFFGDQSPLLYFLPMFAGSIYFVAFHLTNSENPVNNNKFIQYFSYLLYLMVLIQAGNYLMFIKSYF